MINPDSRYIPVTRNFKPILDTLSEVLFQRLNHSPFQSESEIRDWLYETFHSILFQGDLSSAVIKYNEWKIQFTKSGPVGDLSYAVSKDRQDYARRLPSPPYRPTPKRLLQQERVKQANENWKITTPDQRNQWKTAAKRFDIEGVYLFQGIYISLLVDNQPIPDPFLPTPELLQYYKSRKT